MYPSWLIQKIQPIQLVILDVDGVLTRGQVTLIDAEGEGKAFHVNDGGAIRMAQRAGLEVGLLTGRQSEAVARRARELGIRRVLQGAKRKAPALETLVGESDLAMEEIAMIGDGWVDLPVFHLVGLSIAPGDAPASIRARADLVTRAAGGRGAVAEALEMILRIQGRWAEQIERYGAP